MWQSLNENENRSYFAAGFWGWENTIFKTRETLSRDDSPSSKRSTWKLRKFKLTDCLEKCFIFQLNLCHVTPRCEMFGDVLLFYDACGWGRERHFPPPFLSLCKIRIYVHVVRNAIVLWFHGKFFFQWVIHVGDSNDMFYAVNFWRWWIAL